MAFKPISYLETPTRKVGLKNTYLFCDYYRGSHEFEECKQNNTAEQNDDILPWGNSKRKEKGEDGPEWVVRSKFKGELANFMLEKKFYTKGIGEMLDQHLKKQKKDDEDERLLSIFKKIHINLPFLEAMIHMPKGAEVLKDLLSHKEKLEKAASLVKLSEEYYAIIQRSLPQKEGDPRSFILPCLIGPLAVKNALADLGASKNLMSHSLFLRLGISILKPTRMSIKLADRSIKYPIGEASRGPKNHKGAIAWSIADIKGIDSSFCTCKILMEDEFKLSVQPQRRVNPNIKEVVKKEVIKLLDVGLIYPISDSPWVSPVQVVPKKGGMTVVKNELIPQRTVTGWRVCIDYRKLNNTTRNDHFPLLFIDQMLEHLARHEYYCFLDCFSGYF
ncbi:reverse transcriptase domain-containing protein [Tanacetum coccineum]